MTDAKAASAEPHRHGARIPSAAIALTYALAAGTWILLSARYVNALEDGSALPTFHYPTLNGLLFVLVTGLLLYGLVNYSMRGFKAGLARFDTRDSLTGLPTMAVMRAQLGADVNRAKGEGGILAVVTINIDRFQHFVNRYGYDAGDEMLKAVAMRLRSIVRRRDFVSRISGDEFAVALAEIKDQRDLEGSLAILRDGLAAPFQYRDQAVRFSVSAGVALYPKDGPDSEALLWRSATALRRAKSQERGTVAFYTPAVGDEALAWSDIERALSGALERREFTVHYQPQVEARSGRVVGHEALLRWTSPCLGAVSPSRFIPVTEASTLICSIGAWVLRRACQDAAEWRRRGAGDLVLSVNVSARQLKDEAFPHLVQHALEQSGLPANLLELEITEGILMEDAEVMLSRLEVLKRLGVSLAIDDFGTGYSNLGYLRRFQAERLKIDKSFVAGLPHDGHARAIVKTIISLGTSLGMRTIGEGVETREQADALVLLGCDEFQGHLFGYPAPAEQVAGEVAGEALVDLHSDLFARSPTA